MQTGQGCDESNKQCNKISFNRGKQLTYRKTKIEVITSILLKRAKVQLSYCVFNLKINLKTSSFLLIVYKFQFSKKCSERFFIIINQPRSTLTTAQLNSTSEFNICKAKDQSRLRERQRVKPKLKDV